ncbi:MAG TPA: NAD-dependent epimerase/dehydratase family protein [Thermoleophilaceae bacterium]|nr:NAD-dependent epimerase/dehydratase family protein [Thermoleophilaceae bacterium]
MSKVLVTGGAGFIGSFVVDRLRAAGHDAVIFDIRHSPHHARGEVPTVIGDVLDYPALRKAALGCDAIAHLAAAADVGEVAADPERAERLNSRGTFNVLEAAREEGVPRVIYASTIWVYSESEGTVDEEAPLRAPAHLYTATKLAGELYCHSYGELYGLDTTILRSGIPYGPRARPAAVVPSFVRRALAGEPLQIAGSGEQTRRFVYVEDLADGVVRALSPVAARRTYNLVSREDVSIRQIADTVRDLVGDVSIEHTPGRTGDFGGGAEISGERAAAELGWHPQTDFRDGVDRYIAWQRRQEAQTPARGALLPGARLRALGSNAGIAALAMVAGAIAALLSRWGMVSDPVSFLGSVVLLGVPVALIAGLDWARDRVRAALVIVALLVGVLAQVTLKPQARDVMEDARHHHLVIVLMAVAAITALAAARAWRVSRARQGDAAG